MKKLLLLALFESFGASAKDFCFLVETDYPAAADISVENRSNQVRLERYELVPGQYVCKSYSDRTTKNLSYVVHGLCEGKVVGNGRFTLVISNDGCSVDGHRPH